MERHLLTTKELADYIGVSKGTIYNRIYKNTKRRFPIKPIRIGRLVKFDKRKIDEWIDEGCPDREGN